MADLIGQFRAAVARHPDRVAIIDGAGRATGFAQLAARADRLAAAWAGKGIAPGDRVLLAMPLNADLYASLAALWSLGATVVLPEPAMGLSGLRHAARTTRPRAFCAAGWYQWLKFLVPDLWRMTLLRPRGADHTAPPHATAPSDIALISFTSGTTGAPKAIPRSHAFLMAQNDAIAPLLHSDGPEIDLVAFPVFTLINLAAGRTSVLPNWNMTRLAAVAPDRIAGWMTTHGVTRALIPPSLADKLSQTTHPTALHTLFTGGGPVFPDLIQTLRQRPGLRITCVYGSTEAEPIAHLHSEDISSRDLDDMQQGRGLLVGHPVAQVHLRIVDDEIQVAGDHVNDSYLDPAHTAENKITDGPLTWHRTGDAGWQDGAGRLWLWGRVGSQITTDTGPLYPFAAEVAARTWPGVRQAALMAKDGAPLLVLEGAPPDGQAWTAAAGAIGITGIKQVPKIPMDRRHHSKVDRAALAQLI